MSKSHVEYVDFVDEALVVLLYVVVCIFCKTTSNQKIHIGGGATIKFSQMCTTSKQDVFFVQ